MSYNVNKGVLSVSYAHANKQECIRYLIQCKDVPRFHAFNVAGFFYYFFLRNVQLEYTILLLRVYMQVHLQITVIITTVLLLASLPTLGHSCTLELT